MISITTSIVVGLLTYDVTNYFHLGGMHGFLVNDFLIKMAGIWGAIGVSVILVAIVAVIFYNEISVVITKVKEALEARKKRISEEAKQEQETEATAEVEDDKPEEVAEIEDVEETDESGDLVILDFEPKDQDDSTNEEDSIFDPIKEPSEDASLEISTQEIEEAQEIVSNEFDPTAELSRYKFPSIDLLIEHSPGGNSVDIEEQEENKARIIDTILPGAGALATWLPASESEVYAQPQDFYGGQQVYTLLSDYSSKVPAVNLGVYYTEANTALYTLLANVVAGADLDTELQTAKETVEFKMQ